jgi:hypothetical protein
LFIWGAYPSPLAFVFTGGVILTRNTEPADNEATRVLNDRIPVLKLEAAQRQLVALAKSLALQGHRRGASTLSAAECRTQAVRCAPAGRALFRPSCSGCTRVAFGRLALAVTPPVTAAAGAEPWQGGGK